MKLVPMHEARPDENKNFKLTGGAEPRAAQTLGCADIVALQDAPYGNSIDGFIALPTNYSRMLQDYRVKVAVSMLFRRKGSMLAAIIAVSIAVLVIVINNVTFEGVANGIVRDLTDYQYGDLQITDRSGKIQKPDMEIVGFLHNTGLVEGAAVRLRDIASINNTRISRSAGLAFDDSAIMNIDDLRTITDRPNEIDQRIIKLTNSYYQDDLKALLLDAYAHENLKVQTIEEAGREILAGIRSGIAFINLVGYFGMLSASFAIVTIMMLVVSSKTRDIGIMKSLGADRKDVLTVFVLQGLIIGCIAAACAFLVGTAAGLYLQSTTFSFGPGGLVLDIRYDFGFTLSSSLFAILLGTAAAIYPAFRASRLQPVEAMQLI